MRAPIALTILLLGGCATDPPAAPPPAAPVTKLDHALAGADLAAVYRSFGIAAPDGDKLNPDQAVLTALTFNAGLSSAAATAARARADAEVAAQRPNPTISFTPDRIISAVAGGSPWTVALALAWPVLHPGEGKALRNVRSATLEVVRLDLAQAGWQTRSAAMAAFRGVLVARAAEAAAVTAAATDAQRNAASDRLFTAAQSGRAERALVLDAAARSAAEVPARRGARLAAEAALRAALGLPPGINVEPDWPGWRAPPAPYAGDVRRFAELAIFNRLDLQAALAKVRVADAAYAQAGAARGGAISVAPGYTYDKGDHRLQFGITAELPINHGPGARLAAARAARVEAVAQARALQAQLIAEAAAAVEAYRSSYTTLAAWTPIIANARADAARAGRALAAGDGDRPALLEAQARLNAAQLGEIDALAGVLTAMRGLEDAVQRPVWPASKLTSPDPNPQAKTQQGGR